MLRCLHEIFLPAAGSNVNALAFALYSNLCKSSTLLVLKMALKVFGPLKMLNRSLQARYQTVSGMLVALGETIAGLRYLREDEAFDQLLTDAKVVAEMDLEALQVSRQRRPPKHW